MNRPRILLTVGHYLPGYKSGGPLRSIVNLVTTLYRDFDFQILTSDRDLGDASRYDGVEMGAWAKVGHARVRYLSPNEWRPRELSAIIRETEHDLLYLNSFFSKGASISPLLARRLGWLRHRPVLLAPRGEFSPGALSLKAMKKRIYINAARRAGMLDFISWQASSQFEADDIQSAVGAKPQHVLIASDLPDPAPDILPKGQRDQDPILNVLFLSRISPKKNLEYAIHVLSQVKRRLVFNIYGPVEDFAYWAHCQQQIDKLPDHIAVRHHGPINPASVRQVMRDHDLFFLPTKGENYGHVIAEALSVGTRVLISDQTPWRGLAERKMGDDLPLETARAFVDRINDLAAETPEQRLRHRQYVHAAFRAQSAQSHDVENNIEIFHAAIMAARNM